MFDLTRTTDIGSFITKRSSMPLGDLIGSLGAGYRYGYIGTEDRMMYPLITPGAIVQIDPRLKRILPGSWHRESERPIYFLRTRSGFACCWCAIEDGNIILQPHPLSPESARIMSLRQDVEVIGQVIAVAMRLDGFTGPAETP